MPGVFFFKNFLFFIKPFLFSNPLIDKNKETPEKRKDKDYELDLFCCGSIDFSTGDDLPGQTVYGNR